MTEEQVAEIHTDFELMDRDDEEQILTELRGVPVDKFIYKNKRGEWELTYAGAKWVVRKMAEEGEAIRIDGHPKVDRCPIDPEYITCSVLGKRVKVDREAKCETVLDTSFGAARQWIKQKINNGATIIPDEHFYVKCTSRATRNLQLSMIPTDFKKKMIEALKVMQAGGAAPSAKPRGPGRPPGPTSKVADPVQKPQGQPAPGQAVAPAAPAPRPAQPPAPTAPAPAAQAAAPAAAPPPKPPAAAAPKPATAPKPAAAALPAKAAPAAPAKAVSAPAAKPAVANTTKPAPAQTPREAGMDVLFQRFEVVLKQASGAPDRPKMLAFLKELTGKDAVTALSREEITELGPILNALSKGASQFAEGAIRDIVTGEIIWPKQEPQAEPAPEPQAEPAPDEAGDPAMF